MDINPSEAEAALAAIRAADQQVRRTLNALGVAYHLLVWGVIWLLGFTISHFAPYLPPEIANWSWTVLGIVGGALSWIIGMRMGLTFRHPLGNRIGWLVFFFALYGVLGSFFLHPTDIREAVLLLIIFLMLFWAVMGLWTQSALLWVAVAVTGLSVLGYAVVPAFFSLWMAVLGGGTMIGTGLYILRSRR